MLVNDIAVTTMAKARAMTTKIVNGVFARVTEVPWVSRNRKGVLLYLVILLAVILGGYPLYRSTATRASHDFYRSGFVAARGLAAKCRPFVLDQDVLSLNAMIRDVRALESLVFAAVVDHLNIVLAHTDADKINRPFRPLGQAAEIGTDAGVRAIAGLSEDEQDVVGFFQTIRFADVAIGQAMIALDTGDLKAQIGFMQGAYGALITLVLAGGLGILFWLDRGKQKKAHQTQREMEHMDRIGPYVLKSKIAMGGMAELFEADYVREDGFRRKVAIKRIRPHLAENPEFIKMFTREARLAALLQHPNIVQIFDYGKIDSAYFIAMEYIDGKNLGDILAAMKIGLPVAQAVHIVSEICKGLDYSHNRQDDETGTPLDIVHRDISPQNMLISSTGEVKISDFGISKAQSEPNLTQAGIIKGKMAYMSPEQALGQTLDRRADIFALGLLFHETLTGLRVFRFENEIEAIRAIPQRDIEPLTAIMKQIPEGLNRIVMRCLEKDRDKRYQHAADIYADLTALRRDLQLSYDADDLAAFMRNRLMEGDDVDFSL